MTRGKPDNPNRGASSADAFRVATSPRSGAAVLVSVLTVVTFIAFAPSLQNDFVNWDDEDTLVFNEHFQGLSPANLRWMFTTFHTGHYQPLSWLSFAVDWQVWQLRPYGYHLTSIVLHTLGSVLLFFVARRLISAAIPTSAPVELSVAAFLAAAAFAIHPLRAESVAWATERRDVLSGVFLLASLACYVRLPATKRGHAYRRWLGASLVLYTLSLLSKAAGVTMPFVFLVLDVYPLRRWRLGRDRSAAMSIPRLIGEKVLFLIPAVGAGILALMAQDASGALRTVVDHPISLRIGQALYGMFFYVRATLWPMGLIPLYEQDPHAVALEWPNVLSGLAVVLISIICWHLRKRRPAFPVAWAIYLLLLLPVLGIAQSGQQVVADRYSYLSCLPWAVLAGGGVLLAWRAASSYGRSLHHALGGAAVAVLCLLVVLTRAQTRMWRDSVTLWRSVLRRAPDTGSAHTNLAAALNARGDFAEARTHAWRALDLLPGNRAAHIALARSAYELGDLKTAETHYEIALHIRPVDAPRRYTLAHIKNELDKPAEAEAHFREAIQSEPADSHYFVGLASFLVQRNRPDEALPLFAEALRVEPYDVLARIRLSNVLSRQGRAAEALTTLEEGIRLMPGHPVLTAKLAWCLATTSDTDLRNAPRALWLARSVDNGNEEGLIGVREAHAAALAASGDFIAAAALIERTLADSSYAVSDAARIRLKEQLSKYRNGRAITE